MPPLRSWSQKENPPAVPIPGMAGGVKAKATASGTSVRIAWLTRRRIAGADRSALLRSSQGCSETKKKAV